MPVQATMKASCDSLYSMVAWYTGLYDFYDTQVCKETTGK